MRRIEKEFNKKLAGYERELKKLGCLDDETGLIPWINVNKVDTKRADT
ncbi:TPA: hypothetical protein RHK92_002113 [Enterococcus faecalis]|nr:hypothetical protein [Enterococcus faecalis]HDV0888535.1 hypothetical protein [Enterococcus faecalis]